MLTAKDILDDIEFELMQGAVSRDELSQGVQAIKQYQNKLRGEVFQSRGALDRETIARLFQVNDMLITLLQEMAAALQATQRDLRRLGQPARATDATIAPLAQSDEQDDARQISEIERAMREDAIYVPLQARLAHLPVIGRIIGPLQILLHRPALYYVRLFADRQAPVNRAFGDWILALHEREREQRAQIAALRARMNELETRVKLSDESRRKSFPQ